MGVDLDLAAQASARHVEDEHLRPRGDDERPPVGGERQLLHRRPQVGLRNARQVEAEVGCAD